VLYYNCSKGENGERTSQVCTPKFKEHSSVDSPKKSKTERVATRKKLLKNLKKALTSLVKSAIISM